MSTNERIERYRIVVGVDLSVTGDNALREAMRLARRLPDCELHLTYVIRTDRNLHDAKRLESLSKELGARRDELRAHVTRVCAPSADVGAFSMESVFHIRIGEPALAIHQVAVDVDADLIVVGSEGRSGVEKLMLGSVAEELIRIARVPVLVAHPKDFTGQKRSDHINLDPARPGEDLHSASLTDRIHLEFVPRTSHISGLL